MPQTSLYQHLTSVTDRLGPYNGAETALVYTETAAELSCLMSGCGLFDLGWRAKILVTGSDRVRWLNGMVTNNVKDLPVNHGNYDFLLSSQGRILADLYVYNRGEYLLLDTDHAQLETVLKTLDHFIIMDDVELSDSSEQLTAIGLCGPKSEAVLQSAGIDANGMQFLALRDQVLTIDSQPVGISIVRGPEQRPGWYEVWLSSSNAAAVWDRLRASGAQPAGAQALELWRIVHGIPRYGQDIREKDLPQETEQEQALNFSKGCYVGQEIVERIRARGQVHRKFTGFEFQGSLPQPGKIEAEGRVVAEITSVAQVGAKLIGLGYVRREVGNAGAQLEMNGQAATVARLPFQI